MVIQFPRWPAVAGWHFPEDGAGVAHVLVRHVVGGRREFWPLCGKLPRQGVRYLAVDWGPRCKACAKAAAHPGHQGHGRREGQR